MEEDKIVSQIVGNLTDKFYNDVLQPSAQELGYVMGRIAHTLRVIGLVGLIGDSSVIVENILKEKMEKFLYTSFSKTPKEKRILPDPTIICPILENVANSFTKEDLIQLYSNLLSAAINKDMVEKVHPAFINVISQMTPLDAKIFKELTPSFSLISCVILKDNSNIDSSLYNVFLNDTFIKENFIDSSISISNLNRLGLLYVQNNIDFFIEDTNESLIKIFKQSTYYNEQLAKYGEKNINIISQPGYISNLGMLFKYTCLQ